MPISTNATANDDTWSWSTLFAVLVSDPPGGRSVVSIESRNQNGGEPTTAAVTRAAFRGPMSPPGGFWASSTRRVMFPTGVVNCSMSGGSHSTTATSAAIADPPGAGAADADPAPDRGDEQQPGPEVDDREVRLRREARAPDREGQQREVAVGHAPRQDAAGEEREDQRVRPPGVDQQRAAHRPRQQPADQHARAARRPCRPGGAPPSRR